MMGDFIEEYQLELIQAKEVPNTSILYPLCQCYEVEIASKKTGYHMHFYSFLRNKPIDKYFSSDYILETVLQDMTNHIDDGCYETYDLWMDEVGSDYYWKQEIEKGWLEQYYHYARHLYTELGKLVEEEGRAELLNM